MRIDPHDATKIVAQGTFLYAGSVECDICIIREPVQYGTGDDCDLPDIANDVAVETFYVWFGSTTERGVYNSCGGGYRSITEAKAEAERAAGIGSSVRWRQ